MKNKNNKKNNKIKSYLIVIGVFAIALILCSLLNKGINSKKLEGNIGDAYNTIDSLSVSCPSSVNLGSTITCNISVTSSSGFSRISGNLSASNFGMQITPNTSIFNSSNPGQANFDYTYKNYTDANPVLVTGTNNLMSVVLTPKNTGSGSLTITAGSRTASQNVTINPKPDDDNSRLKSLSATGISINFSTNGLITDCGTYNVDTNQTSTTVSATTSNPSATVTGTGVHQLSYGNNNINVTVTSPNKKYQTTYNFVVFRPTEKQYRLSENVNIGSLTVTGSDGKKIDIGTVNGNKSDYSASVNYNITSVNISATSEDSSMTVSGTGKNDINIRNNTFIVTVSGKQNSKSYKVNIYRNDKTIKKDNRVASKINSLKSLDVSNTTISKVFSSSTTSYKRSVKKNVGSITIKATPTDSRANISGVGTFNLNNGLNYFNVVVTAEAGNKKVYSLTIYKEYEGEKPKVVSKSNSSRNNSSNPVTDTKKIEDNNILKSLTINGDKIVLENNTYSYNYTVKYETTKLNIKATPKTNKSKVEITGLDNLQVGVNIIKISLKDDKNNEKTYLINVTRKDKGEKLSSDSKLSMLEIKNYKIDFDPKKYNYDLKIKKEKQLIIDYMASNENSSVVIKNNNNLKNNSVIKIIVTAEDGSNSKYLINIKKSANIGLIIGIIAIVLVVGAIGALVYLIITKKISLDFLNKFKNLFKKKEKTDTTDNIFEAGSSVQADINNNNNNKK